MLIALAAAGALLFQAQPAAQPAPATTPAAVAPGVAAPKKPKLICTSETATDSIIPKRVCRTPEQIEAERVASRRSIDTLQDRAGTCRTAGC